MASNALPANLDLLFTLAEDLADGLTVYQGAVGVLHNTELKVRADLLAAQTTQTNCLAARTAKAALTTAQTVADSNTRAWIGITRDVLAVTLGSQWSPAWIATGFATGSLAIPFKMEERQALLAAWQSYLTAHPNLENAPLFVTAARAGLLYTALSDARSAVAVGLVNCGQTKLLRDDAENQLRLRMRGLIEELTQLLDPNDPRWPGFGLVAPADTDQPGIPEGLLLTAGVPGSVLVDWANAPRAAYYRVYRQVVGSDPQFVLAASVQDSDATLTGLPSGATLIVHVLSVNADGDESLPSDPQQITVP